MPVAYIDTKADFDAKLKEAGDKAVIVDFTASWCPPCQMIAPVLEELATANPTVIVYKVDVDKNEETSEAAGISAMPTFQVYKNGEKVEEMCGASKGKLEELFQKYK